MDFTKPYDAHYPVNPSELYEHSEFIVDSCTKVLQFLTTRCKLVKSIYDVLQKLRCIVNVSEIVPLMFLSLSCEPCLKYLKLSKEQVEIKEGSTMYDRLTPKDRFLLFNDLKSIVLQDVLKICGVNH